jgi:DNA-binding transcriptional ArsR family regulator
MHARLDIGESLHSRARRTPDAVTGTRRPDPGNIKGRLSRCDGAVTDVTGWGCGSLGKLVDFEVLTKSRAGGTRNCPREISLQLGVLLLDLTVSSYFCNYRNMPTARRAPDKVVKYADMFSAMGTEARLRIMQLLLAAHPDGLVVGEIQAELDIPNSTLSHHLDKLKSEDLVNVSRESTFLRYTANTDALQEVLQFLYAECCTRNKALKPESIITICK